MKKYFAKKNVENFFAFCVYPPNMMDILYIILMMHAYVRSVLNVELRWNHKEEKATLP